MLVGLSTWRYEGGFQPVGKKITAATTGFSKSSLSRRFVAATAERLAEFRAWPLDEDRWLIVFLYARYPGFRDGGLTVAGSREGGRC
jgi:putative transposase